MPPVDRIEPIDDSAPRRWQGWFARLLIPLVVLFTGLLAETVGGRFSETGARREAAAPPADAGDARRQGGLVSARQGAAVIDDTWRRAPLPPADAGADPFVAPALLSALLAPVAAATAAWPAGGHAASGGYPPGRPRAPPA